MSRLWVNRAGKERYGLPSRVAVLATAIFCVAQVVQGANLARVVRRATGVAEDVPVRRLDEVVEETARSRAGRKVLAKLSGVSDARRLDDAVEHAAAVRKALQRVGGAADPVVLKEVERLGPGAKEGVVMAAYGGQRLKSVVPDLALRSRLLREGGAETLAAIGRFDDLAEDVVRFDTALKAGKLPSPPGARALTVSDFGSFFHKQGDRADHFWRTYVRPHWKLWVGSAALAAVLLTPEEYLDAAGDLTREGLEKLGRVGGKLLGDALAGLAKGAVEGAGGAVKDTVETTLHTVWRTFFTRYAGILSAALLIVGAMLVVRPIRRGMKWLVTVPFASWYNSRRNSTR